ncbi:MAG: lipid-A-disaccharide synthase [Pseudomonadales bacterium]|nr:lipid-A-disaccharide synthase [Pseudomonadales bacterium]
MKIGILAGEASGDRLAAGLMQAIKKKYPTAQFQGVGGSNMQSAGLVAIADYKHLSIMGFREPLMKLPQLYSLLRKLEAHYRQWQPDVFVGIDFNVFNFYLEKRLKRQSLKTVHYVSPSVYAWRRGRIKSIRQSVDRILTLYPFEPELYKAEGVDAVFVGHPMADEIIPDDGSGSATLSARQSLGLKTKDTVVALLPGSRSSELNLMATCFLGAAVRIDKFCKQTALLNKPVFVIPCPTQHLYEQMQTLVGNYQNLDIRLLLDHARTALAACDVALVKSGTSSLEAMMLGKPMVVSYKLGRLTYNVVKKLKYGDYVALPNILAGRLIVPELLQDDARPETLAAAIQRRLVALAQGAPEILAEKQEFMHMHASLRCNANDRAAQAILEIAGE